MTNKKYIWDWAGLSICLLLLAILDTEVSRSVFYPQLVTPFGSFAAPLVKEGNGFVSWVVSHYGLLAYSLTKELTIGGISLYCLWRDRIGLLRLAAILMAALAIWNIIMIGAT